MASVGRTRETGATATLERMGRPEVTSFTGGVLPVATRPSEAGFNPLDLLYAALSACIVLSARMAASELGMLDRFASARATVTGTKAADGLSRVEQLRMEVEIHGDLDAAERERITERAGALCTVSNTLKALPQVELVSAPGGA